MSVHKRTGQDGWVVRYREGTKQRSRAFDRKGDADDFETELRRRRQLGGLGYLNAGTETLGEYVTETWSQAHAAHLAPKTRESYADMYDTHIGPHLGEIPLRSLTPETIAHWQAQLLRDGRSADSVRRVTTLLGSMLQRATESKRIVANPQRLVRRVPKPIVDEVRPLAPETVERLRRSVLTLARKGNVGDRTLRHRDAVLISLLAYAGLRPQEARGLTWRHLREQTLLVDAPKTRQRRTVRLLAPLRQDLAEWRLASGRPDDLAPIIAAADGSAWSNTPTSRGAAASRPARSRQPESSISARTTCATASRVCCCTRAALSSTSRASSATARA